MRAMLVPLLLVIAGCQQERAVEQSDLGQSAAEDTANVFTAGGRDRLCLSPKPGGNAGLITFAAGSDANCSLRGRWEEGPDSAVIPMGDEQCRISLNRAGDVVTLGSASPSCAYYCGPGAAYAGKTFTRMENSEPVTDIAGDELC